MDVVTRLNNYCYGCLYWSSEVSRASIAYNQAIVFAISYWWHYSVGYSNQMEQNSFNQLSVQTPGAWALISVRLIKRH